MLRLSGSSLLRDLALTGFGGGPTCDVRALEDALLRVSAMVEDLPQIAELDLNPTFVHPTGVTVVNARIESGNHLLSAASRRARPTVTQGAALGRTRQQVGSAKGKAIRSSGCQVRVNGPPSARWTASLNAAFENGFAR